MKTTLVILLTTILIAITSCGQSNSKDCETNLDKIPYFATHNASLENDSVLIDFKILKECGQMDSIDSQLINGPMLGTIMVAQASEKNKITYRTILEKINAFKQTSDYKTLREVKLIENKIVNLADWEKDKQVLAIAGMPETEIENLKEFIKIHSIEKMTFKQAYASYIDSKPKEETKQIDRLAFADLGDIDNVIKAGKENKKAILLYFTCYACANARKIEDNILTDELVKSLITENYVYFSAYVDDKTPDTKTNSTIGNKYLKLQSEKFKNNYQPNFIIIDNKGNVVANLGYTNKTNEFVDFLKKGLK